MRERDGRCITIFLMPDDIEKQVSAESDYGLKGMTTTFEIVSWERLAVDCQSGVSS
jgi:hypothetical protein